MKQQIRFFETLLQRGTIKDKPIILLLNKTDLLEQLITTKPISKYFEDYTGGANCLRACQFFAEKFAKCDYRAVGDLRIYKTCAVEANYFRGIFKDLPNDSPSYIGTNPNRLEDEGSEDEGNIHNPVAQASSNKDGAQAKVRFL